MKRYNFVKIKLRNIVLLFLSVISIYSFIAVAQELSENIPEQNENTELIYPLTQKDGSMPEALNQSASPIDLKDPDNLRTSVTYDPNTGHYVIHNSVGGEDISNPYVLNADEYKDYSMQQSMRNYWLQKNSMQTLNDEEEDFSLTDMQFNIGKGDKIFGPGGIQVKTQGSAELIFGIRKSKVDNPILTERSRNPPASFDFDEKIQLSVRGSVGDKLGMSMNYNTEASFDFDQKLIKLAYEGKEDEIIQSIEAGNISMPLSTSLITGSSSLFGVKTQLKFGRLTIDALISQQESEKKTVSLRDGAQTTPFEINADAYDENRHFFLAHYFYENYDKAMSSLPYINSSVEINRIEVWVTNKRGNYDQVRNIVALTDLGEAKTENMVEPPKWYSTGIEYPSNYANNLYDEIKEVQEVRDPDAVGEYLGNILGLEGGEEFEKVRGARLLTTSEYTLNRKLGYISLKAALNSDEVLAVAYDYTAGGKTYQVGEFSTNINSDLNTPSPSDPAEQEKLKKSSNLILKILKGTNLHPQSPTWQLMMKNVYSTGGYQLQSDKFELNVLFQSDSTGVYLNYLPDTPLETLPLIKVMNLDRLDSHNESRSDGFFDYVEGYTVDSQTGKIMFPVVEPFGSYLKNKLTAAAQKTGDTKNYDKYIFQELYDSTLVVAQEYSEKNKYRLKGKYKGSSGSEIRLDAMNVPKGSVTVTAGGVKLSENIDYTVDYTMGTVNIINTDILNSGTAIDVSLENQSFFNTQRKTLLGTHLDYRFNQDFNIGATVMHLSEKPLTEKVSMGSEPISNTIWGFNTSYKTQSQWLTNMLDKLPLLKVKEPSSISFNAEFAQLIPGTSSVINNYAYVDDFESTKISIDIHQPSTWKLSSTPDVVKFPEAKLSNDVTYGYNRALLAWYFIDPAFTRRNYGSNYGDLDYIQNDVEQQSNFFVREVREQEIFPNRDPIYSQTSYLTILNLAYYPTERGPYNLDLNITGDGKLNNPKKRWGGIMRKLETTDFETANIEYLEFWLMDPFVYDNTAEGGDLYFNLGDISEDILKDGKKSFENGLPTDGDLSKVDATEWGYVPRMESMSNGFNTSDLSAQDVGLDGLSDEEEKAYKNYKVYLDNLNATLSSTIKMQMISDPYSPLNDPAGDNFHHYRGSDYNSEKLGVLDRYKRYNNVQGNSDQENGSYSNTGSGYPDTEDINSDNTLSEYERFYEYKVSLRPADMEIGKNNIVDIVTSTVKLADETTGTVNWYQFKIPVQKPDLVVGKIRNFKSIRFIRMYMTDFAEETHLRFATLSLVKGEWRKYTKDIRFDEYKFGPSDGLLDVAAVNIEENSAKEPVPYVLPPGVERVVDPSQSDGNPREENEQSMSLNITNLDPKDARAVYKNSGMDMRQYKRLQLFVHAEEQMEDISKPISDPTKLKDGDLSVFLRLGSDHTANFYEYEIPLKITSVDPPFQVPVSEADRYRIWPEENMFDFALDELVQAKNERNRKMKNPASGVSISKPYPKLNPDNSNTIRVMGNPTLSEVQVIMIGVRNNSDEIKSVEVWVDELRLSEFNQEGGYAALANMVVNLSDFASVSVSGRTETVGFGGIEQGVMDRRIDDYYQLNISTGVELGRFLPEKSKIRIPFYYSQSHEVTTPKYNPLDQDVVLEDALENAATEEEREKILDFSQTVNDSKSISFSNVKVDIQSKKPQFYDPANLSASYTYNRNDSYDPEIEYETTKTYRGTLNYNYSTTPKPFEPFAKVQALNAKPFRLIKDFNVNYIPSYIAYTNNIDRYYYEMQVRDLTGNGKLAPSFKQDFMWARNFDLKYDFSRSLKFTLSTATNARIDEPYGVVNKDLYYDEYQHWKDSVWSNIMKFGRPIQYQQIFTGEYNVPLNKIQALNWITLRGTYNSTYNWDRGVTSRYTDEDGQEVEFNLGNTAANIRTWQLDSRLNLETLYKKSPYLASVNDKYSGRKQPATSQPKEFKNKVSLKAGVKREIRHRLGTMNIEVKATDAEGNIYPVKYKKVDANTISLTSKEDVNNLNIMISTSSKEETAATKMLQGTSRFLMMIRNVSGTYKETNSLIMPGYQPTSGFLGQDSYNSTKAPGYDFVFGFYDNASYLKKAQEKGWLSREDTIGNPVAINKMTDLQLRASVEPLRAFKVEINAARATSNSQSIQFYEDIPINTFMGTFSMTDAAIGTALMKIGKSGNFDSEAYNKFLDYREDIAQRIEAEYAKYGTPIPAGSFNRNSADVLIPAFRAAYTNRKVSKSSLNILPSIWQILPNWRITYSGLSNVNVIKKYFKSVNITHAYRCTYNVASYSSLLDWEGGGPNGNRHYGSTTNIIDGSQVFTSQYDVSSVVITESFSPLFGVDVATQNDISFKFEYKRQRTLNLSIAGIQMVESYTDEWVFGAGYKLKNFNTILRIKQKQGSVSHDLTLRGDISLKDIKSVIRKIEDGYSQPTAGNRGLTIKFTADYVFSDKINIGAYFDRNSNTPFISSSYPTVNSNFGVTFRFLLTR